MYGAEHLLLYEDERKGDKKMMPVGISNSYGKNLLEARKHNANFDKMLTDFFKVKKVPGESAIAIELKKSDTDIEMKVLKTK